MWSLVEMIHDQLSHGSHWRDCTICRPAVHKVRSQCNGVQGSHADKAGALQVTTQNSITGTIEGSFGKSGKFKVAFPEGIVPGAPGQNSVTLTFKRFIYDQNKRNMVQ